MPFQVVGAVGILWVMAWFASIRPRDLSGMSQSNGSQLAASTGRESLWSVVVSRRFAVALVVIFQPELRRGLLSEHDQATRSVVQAHHGRVVKSLGDAVMIHTS